MSANGNLECVQELLRRGARSLGNSSGNTPLHWAVLNKHLEVTVELLTNLPDCDVLRKNDFGRSSLTEAFQTNDEKILEVVRSASLSAPLLAWHRDHLQHLIAKRFARVHVACAS